MYVFLQFMRLVEESLKSGQQRNLIDYYLPAETQRQFYIMRGAK